MRTVYFIKPTARSKVTSDSEAALTIAEKTFLAAGFKRATYREYRAWKWQPEPKQKPKAARKYECGHSHPVK